MGAGETSTTDSSSVVVGSSTISGTVELSVVGRSEKKDMFILGNENKLYSFFLLKD